MDRIRTTLMIRGVWGVSFAMFIGTRDPLSWQGYFDRFDWYLVTDGLLGVLVGGTLVRESVATQREREMVLGIATLTDAAGRLCSGAALLVWPGIAGFPVTSVIFIAIMALGTASVGLVEAGLTAREAAARHGRSREAPQLMAGPVGIAALLSIAFGAWAIIWIGSMDRVRMLISGFVMAAGAVSIAMAESRRRMEQRGGQSGESPAPRT